MRGQADMGMILYPSLNTPNFGRAGQQPDFIANRRLLETETLTGLLSQVRVVMRENDEPRVQRFLGARPR